MKFNAMAKFSFAQKIRNLNTSCKNKMSNMQNIDFADLFTSNKDMIMKGTLWGLSITALIISMANIKTAHDAKVNSKNAIESFIAENDSISDTTVKENYDSLYENIQNAIDSTLQTELATYINSYVSENGSDIFFTKDTISTISTQVENSILSKLKETTNTLSSAQETIIRQIISEQIQAIDYSALEKEISSQIEKLSTSSSQDLEKESLKLSNEITAKVSGAVSNISSGIADKLTTKEYTKGEYVTVDGKLYECVQDCTITDSDLESALKKHFKEASLTTALANMSTNLNASITALATDTDTKIKTLSTDTDTRINELSADTDIRINELSTDTNERINSLSADTDEKINTLATDTDDRINTLSADTKAAIEELSAGVDKALYELSETLTAEMNAKYEELSGTIAANYDELSALISTNSGAITSLQGQVKTNYDELSSLNNNNRDAISSIQSQLKASSGTNFQFGYSNGAYGYYVNGSFYPF